jgi:formylmethanofuran dehydrogenase subunit C
MMLTGHSVEVGEVVVDGDCDKNVGGVETSSEEAAIKRSERCIFAGTKSH